MSQLFADVGASVLLRAAAIVAAVGASIIVARLGGPDVKGIAAAFAAASTLSSALVNLGVAEQVVETTTSRRQVDPRRLLLGAWAAYVVLGGAVTLALVPLAGQRAEIVVLGCLCFTLFAQAGVVALGLSGVLSQAVGALLQPLALGLVAVLLAIDGVLTGPEAVAATVASYLCPLAVFWRAIPRPPHSAAIGWRSVLRLFRSSVPWQLPALSLRVVQRADIIVVSVLVSSVVAGTYSVALQLSELILLVPRQVAGHCYHSSVMGRAFDLGRALWTATAAALLPAVAIAIAGGPAIVLLFGDEFRAAGTPLLLLLPGAVFASVALVMSHVFRGQGRLREAVVASGCGALTMLVGCGLLVPGLGANGAALASTASWAVFALVGCALWFRAGGRWVEASGAVAMGDGRPAAPVQTTEIQD